MALEIKIAANNGDVLGPASDTSTDNAIARWDGITGHTLQDSDVIIEDTANIDHADAGGTLSIGASNATTVNIGKSGATVNIIGTTNYQNVTNLQVTDKLVTINKGGSAGSGSASGIEIEENNVITGYVKTSADRNNIEFKAPNTAGIVSIVPGSTDYTIDNTVVKSTSGSATDNTLVRMDSTTGKVVQSTGVVVDDSNNMSGLGTVTATRFDATGTSIVIDSDDTNTTTIQKDGTQAAAITLTLPKVTSTIISDSSTSTLTNKTIDAEGTGNSLTNIKDSNIKASAAIAVNKLAAVTADKAIVSDASGFISASTTTATEIGYVNGVTSAIQTQLDGKQATGNYITALTGHVAASGPGSVASTIQNNVITNAMVNSAAAISYSKLNLGTSIVNADVSASAAIAYSKLNLATSIVNADISTSAAIARSKIASGTANHAIINDGSGNLSSVAPGTEGNVLTSVSGVWTSQAPANTQLIYLRATSTAGQSIGTGGATLNFATEVEDTHGAWATNFFTAPKDCVVDVTCNVRTGSVSWSSTDFGYLTVVKNSTDMRRVTNTVQAAYTDGLTLTITDTVRLASGDTLSVRMNHSEASSISLSTAALDNTITIAQRLGS